MNKKKPLSHSELSSLMRSGSILSKALKEVVQAIQNGITKTSELDQIAERAIRQEHAIPSFQGYRGYPASLCVSINDEIVHGIPHPNKIIKNGDVVGLDLGVVFQGMFTDLATTVPIGKVVQKAQKLLTVTRQALKNGLKAVKPGAHTGDIGAAVQGVVEGAGFSVIRDLVGHGVGRGIHEEPAIPNFGTAGEGTELEPGMVLAIEPMVSTGRYEIKMFKDGWTVKTLDQSLAAHEERTVLVSENGYELVTPWD